MAAFDFNLLLLYYNSLIFTFLRIRHFVGSKMFLKTFCSKMQGLLSSIIVNTHVSTVFVTVGNVGRIVDLCILNFSSLAKFVRFENVINTNYNLLSASNLASVSALVSLV